MYKIWFYRYKRLEYRDSSGFEHVFLGEISRGKVTGFHNWIQLYHLERKNELDYRGFFRYYNVEVITYNSVFKFIINSDVIELIAMHCDLFKIFFFKTVVNN